MEHLTILASPEGRWVLPGTSEFFAALGDPDPDYDAVSFAVRNLGFIKFEVIRQSVVEIELHPRNIELPALLALQQQLLSSDLRLFRIKFFDESWRSEILSSAEATISRLSELCRPHFLPSAHDRFLVEPQDFGMLFEDEDNKLRIMAQKWRVSFGHFDPGIITLAMHNEFLQRLAIIGVKPRQQHPVWRFLGYGHRWIGGGNFLQTGLGEKVADIPDKDYGEWASTFYRSVAESGRPRYDLITPRSSTRTSRASRGGRSATRDCCCRGKRRPRKFLSRMCSKPADRRRRVQPNRPSSWDDDPSDRSEVRKLAMSS